MLLWLTFWKWPMGKILFTRKFPFIIKVCENFHFRWSNMTWDKNYLVKTPKWNKLKCYPAQLVFFLFLLVCRTISRKLHHYRTPCIGMTSFIVCSFRWYIRNFKIRLYYYTFELFGIHTYKGFVSEGGSIIQILLTKAFCSALTFKCHQTSSRWKCPRYLILNVRRCLTWFLPGVFVSVEFIT